VNATATWSVTPIPASGGSSTTQSIPNASGRQLSYALPDQLQPPNTGRTITVGVLDRKPDGSPCVSLGSVTLPAVHPVACPTTITLELRLNNQPISPSSSNPSTYTNLAAGHYELTVTAPVGADVRYDWFAGAVTSAQSGASNSFGFDLSTSNSPRAIEIFVRAGDCCPVLSSSATLTIASATTPEPSPPSPPVTPETPSDPGTSGGTSLCGILRALAALALVVLFVSVMFVVCPSVLTPIAAPAAAAAAIAAAALLGLAVALCRLGFCGFWGIVIWALRWSIVLGVLIAILLLLTSILFLPVVMCVVLVGLGYGIACGLLIIWITGRGCTIPSGLSWP
jgi:hypothetical protein